MKDQEIETKAMDVWNKSQEMIQVKAVEKDTPAFIASAQKKGISIIAITARTLDIADQTLKQLKSIQIDLSKTSIHRGVLRFTKADLQMKDEVLMKDGVVFVGENNNKGEVLVSLLQKLNLKPKKIVYVDDKPKHVQNVEKSLSSRNIPYYGFRYGAADQKVKAYNELMAEIKDQNTARLFLLGQSPIQKDIKQNF